ncbi:MAG: hypothetical protein GF393_04030 [Armatimonadia bacterium]|nr:hypothetical protein [Armatimonadia bacterium]
MNLSDKTKRELLASMTEAEIEAELERRKEPEYILDWSKFSDNGLVGRIYDSILGSRRGILLGHLEGGTFRPMWRGVFWRFDVRDAGRDLIRIADEMGW